MRSLRTIASIVPVALATLAGTALADDATTFTYQGSLSESGGVASGAFPMEFRLYSASTGGTLLGTINAGSVDVIDGVFSVDLDFGASDLSDAGRWLEIEVDGTTLAPRQQLRSAPYAIQTRGIFVNNDGNIGLGGTLATELLTLRDNDANILMLSQGNNFGPRITMRNTESGIATIHGRIIFDDGSPQAIIGYSKPAGSPEGLTFSDASGVQMKITQGGFTGIGGELDPQSLVHIQSADINLDESHHASFVDLAIEGSDAGLGLFSTPGGVYGSAISLSELSGGQLVDNWSIGRTTSGTGAASTLFFKYGSNPSQSANSSKLVISPDGNVGIGVSVPQAMLHVDGNARVNVLEVTGADLAEKFPSADGTVFEPGMVLEIDPQNPGMVRLATGEYSRLVAGIVSGANGLPAGTVMGNLPGLEDSPAIALSGRVWVRCDTSNGAVEPGDLMTTSHVPGHAMSVTDHTRAMGSVLGKAMTGLDKGERGMVLVLVGLQ